MAEQGWLLRFGAKEQIILRRAVGTGGQMGHDRILVDLVQFAGSTGSYLLRRKAATQVHCYQIAAEGLGILIGLNFSAFFHVCSRFSGRVAG